MRKQLFGFPRDIGDVLASCRSSRGFARLGHREAQQGSMPRRKKARELCDFSIPPPDRSYRVVLPSAAAWKPNSENQNILPDRFRDMNSPLTLIAAASISGHGSGTQRGIARMPSAQRKRLSAHRRCLERCGGVRVEVQVRKEDAILVRDMARALSDPAREAEGRAFLRERFGATESKGLKALLAAAPLEGIDLTRERDLGAAVINPFEDRP